MFNSLPDRSGAQWRTVVSDHLPGLYACNQRTLGIVIPRLHRALPGIDQLVRRARRQHDAPYRSALRIEGRGTVFEHHAARVEHVAVGGPAAEPPVAGDLVAALHPVRLAGREQPAGLHDVEVAVERPGDLLVQKTREDAAVEANHHAPAHARVGP